jgi:hypothetical protein
MHIELTSCRTALPLSILVRVVRSCAFGGNEFSGGDEEEGEQTQLQYQVGPVLARISEEREVTLSSRSLSPNCGGISKPSNSKDARMLLYTTSYSIHVPLTYR